MSPTRETRSTTDPGVARRRRRRRVVLWALALPIMLLGLAGVLATRSWVMVRFLQPYVAEQLRAGVSIDQVVYEGDGWFSMHDVELRAPKYDGPAGDVVHIDRAMVRADLGSLFRGNVRITDVTCSDVLLRLCEDARDPGTFTLMTIGPRDTGGPPREPPSITLDNVTIEMGSLIADAYIPIGQRTFDGRLVPSGERNWFDVHLIEQKPEQGRPLVTVSGQWNRVTREYDLRLGNLRLDNRTFVMCPQAARAWWEEMSLEGEVAEARAGWTPDEGFVFTFDVHDVGLTMPIYTEGVWATYRSGTVEPSTGRPRMQVHRGSIELTERSLTLSRLSGDLISTRTDIPSIPVPWRVDLEIRELDTVDLFTPEGVRTAAETLPFEAVFEMDQFELPVDTEEPPAIEVPEIVATILAKFEMTGWALDSEVHLTRESPDRNADGTLTGKPILTNGKAFLWHAAGTYHKFAYPLTDVEAAMRFDNERLEVEYLRGRGAEDSRVVIVGTVAPPRKEAEVHLEVFAERVPLDDRLRAALPPGTQRAFNVLLASQELDSLTANGLVPGPDAHAALESGRRDLAARRRDLEAEGDAEAAAALGRELDRVDRLLEAGTFEPGGYVDLDLDVDREAGEGQRMVTTGRISVSPGENLGIVFDRFPYPLQVLDGWFELGSETVTLRGPGLGPEEPGLRVVTLQGGHGSARGIVRTPRVDGRRRVRPDIALTMLGDTCSDVLLASIPLSAHERAEMPPDRPWPGGTRSAAAEILASIGLRGELRYAGTIGFEEAVGKPAYDMLLELTRGRLEPPGIDASSDLGLAWPAELTVDDVEGVVRLQRDTVEIVGLSGTHRGAPVTVEGLVDRSLQPAVTTITITVEEAPIEPYFLDLVTGEAGDRLRELWATHHPAGTFSAELELTMHGRDVEHYALRIRPDTVQATVFGLPATLVRTHGQVLVEDGTVALEDLVLDVRRDGRDEGHLVLNGAIQVPEPNVPRVHGHWTDARFDAPWIARLVEIGAGPGAVRAYETLQPQGTFNAVFDVQPSADGGLETYEVKLAPRDVRLLIKETTVEANFATDAIVELAPDIVTVDLPATYPNGSFRVHGTVDPANGPVADLRLDLESNGLDDQLLAFLPKRVRSAFEAIELDVKERVNVADASLRLERRTGSDGATEWGADFDGRIDVAGGVFKAGLAFSDAHGGVIVRAVTRPGESPWWKFGVDADRVIAGDRLVTNGSTAIELSPEGDAVLVRNIEGDLYGGRVSGEAKIGIGDRKEYDLRVDISGADLRSFATGESDDEVAEDKVSGGELNASMALGGRRDEPDSRWGRGAMLVPDGRIASMPVMLRILQAAQLVLPIDESFHHVDVAFFVQGDRIHFERLDLYCQTLKLQGRGEMTFGTLELDTRFQPRGMVTVLSDIVAIVSDQLYELEVTGPLEDPAVRVIALPMFEGSGQTERGLAAIDDTDGP